MILLPECPAALHGRQGKPYKPYPGQWEALQAAAVLGRPLLLSGEPGCGKTEFAWVAARVLHTAANAQWPLAAPRESHIRSDSRARDLLYHYDAVQRFAEAQVVGVRAETEAKLKGAAAIDALMAKVEDSRRFITLRPLARALLAATREVVLIDELDKAPRDVPNDLLRVLESGEFDIPEIPDDGGPQGAIDVADWRTWRRQMSRGDSRGIWPLVIITCNDEKRLPEAFLRRCVFYPVPSPTQEFIQQVVAARHPETAGGEGSLSQRIAAISHSLREHNPPLEKPPSVSEILDWSALLIHLKTAPAALQTFRPGAWQGLPGWSTLIKHGDDALVRLRLRGKPA